MNSANDNSMNSDNPRKLHRLFVVSAMVSIGVISLLSVFIFYRVFSGFVISSAEADSVQLCHVMVDQQRPLLVPATPGALPATLAIQTRDLYRLDQSLRRFLHPFGILRIKIYDTSRRIIYSTDASLAGRTDEKNPRLSNALTGNIDTKLVTKEKAQDLADEQLLDVDVVETYVPIRSESGGVLGVFEIYMNVTKYRSQINMGVVVMSLALFLVLTAAFVVSYIIISRGLRQLKEAQSKLEKLAVTDALTEINNRGQLIARGEVEFARLRRNRKRNLPYATLSCIMLDIDHFKNVNDRKGHLVGDEVLKRVAQRLLHCVRPYDVIGRYAGEEFVVLLPDTSLKQSLHAAERIRSCVGAEPFIVDGAPISITVSVGVAGSNENDRDLSDLLQRADEGLLKAKQGGRDRVAWVYHPFDSELHT